MVCRSSYFLDDYTLSRVSTKTLEFLLCRSIARHSGSFFTSVYGCVVVGLFPIFLVRSLITRSQVWFSPSVPMSYAARNASELHGLSRVSRTKVLHPASGRRQRFQLYALPILRVVNSFRRIGGYRVYVVHGNGSAMF